MVGVGDNKMNKMGSVPFIDSLFRPSAPCLTDLALQCLFDVSPKAIVTQRGACLYRCTNIMQLFPAKSIEKQLPVSMLPLRKVLSQCLIQVVRSNDVVRMASSVCVIA